MDRINELVEPGIGHNSGAALAEVLVEETAALKERAEALIAGAQRAIITDLDGAKRATTLCGMMIAHGKMIEAEREARKKPFYEACKTVDQHFGQLRTALVGADPKRLGGEALRIRGLVDEFYREEERRAEVERQRLEEEARQKREAAEAAERERQEAESEARRAALAGDVKAALARSGTRIDAELRQRQLEEEARRLDQQATQARVGPINTGLGISAHRKSDHKAVITDWTAALRHARKVNEIAIREAVQQIYNRQVRAGVRSLPGANIIEDRQTIIRRA